MYSITRADAAKKLGVSTRSVDRYVKSGKLRSKKEGKIIYIHSKDIENLSWESKQEKAQVIIPKEKTQSYSENASSYTQEKSNAHSKEVMDAQSRATLEKIYLDMKQDIKTKDQAIQDLSIKLGQAQEIAKNSVSLIEFKKSQFLLEESKWHLAGENTDLKEKASMLTQKLKYEKTTNYILIVFCVILVVSLWVLWFMKI
jgi:hypothetical protein